MSRCVKMSLSVALHLLFLATAALHGGILAGSSSYPPQQFSTGSPFPYPASMITTNESQVVKAMLFRFKATMHSCDILESAFVRYFDIIFHGQPSYKKHTGEDVNDVEKDNSQRLLFKPNEVVGVTSLDVAVQQPCEKWPSLEMDESCKLSATRVTFAAYVHIFNVLIKHYNFFYFQCLSMRCNQCHLNTILPSSAGAMLVQHRPYVWLAGWLSQISVL